MYSERVQFAIGTEAGETNVTLKSKAAFVRFVGVIARDVALYAGYGQGEPIARVRAWEQRDIELPYAVDSLTVTWDEGVADTIFDALVSEGPLQTTGGQAAGVVLDRAERSAPAPWAAADHPRPLARNVGLVGLAYRVPGSTMYAPWDGIPRRLATYATTAKRPARDYSTNQAFAAAGTQLALTLWHAGQSKYVRLVRADVALVAATAAAEVWADLVRIDTQPTGGSAVTVAPYAAAQAASVVEARRVPSGGGAVASEPMGSALWRVGITGSDPTGNPAPPPDWQTLYAPDYAAEQLPYVVAGAGLAIVLDVNAATTIRWSVRVKWVEED